RIAGQRRDRDRSTEGGSAVLRSDDDLRVRVFPLGVGVFGPERLDRSVRGDRHLTGLALAAGEVVVAGADLDRPAPGEALVIAVCDVELHVTEAGARVTEHRPEDMHAPAPGARR